MSQNIYDHINRALQFIREFVSETRFDSGFIKLRSRITKYRIARLPSLKQTDVGLPDSVSQDRINEKLFLDITIIRYIMGPDNESFDSLIRPILFNLESHYMIMIKGLLKAIMSLNQLPVSLDVLAAFIREKLPNSVISFEEAHYIMNRLGFDGYIAAQIIREIKFLPLLSKTSDFSSRLFVPQLELQLPSLPQFDFGSDISSYRIQDPKTRALVRKIVRMCEPAFSSSEYQRLSSNSSALQLACRRLGMPPNSTYEQLKSEIVYGVLLNLAGFPINTVIIEPSEICIKVEQAQHILEAIGRVVNHRQEDMPAVFFNSHHIITQEDVPYFTLADIKYYLEKLTQDITSLFTQEQRVAWENFKSVDPRLRRRQTPQETSQETPKDKVIGYLPDGLPWFKSFRSWRPNDSSQVTYHRPCSLLYLPAYSSSPTDFHRGLGLLFLHRPFVSIYELFYYPDYFFRHMEDVEPAVRALLTPAVQSELGPLLTKLATVSEICVQFSKISAQETFFMGILLGRCNRFFYHEITARTVINIFQMLWLCFEMGPNVAILRNFLKCFADRELKILFPYFAIILPDLTVDMLSCMRDVIPDLFESRLQGIISVKRYTFILRQIFWYPQVQTAAFRRAQSMNNLEYQIWIITNMVTDEFKLHGYLFLEPDVFFESDDAVKKIIIQKIYHVISACNSSTLHNYFFRKFISEYTEELKTKVVELLKLIFDEAEPKDQIIIITKTLFSKFRKNLDLQTLLKYVVGVLGRCDGRVQHCLIENLFKPENRDMLYRLSPEERTQIEVIRQILDTASPESERALRESREEALPVEPVTQHRPR